MNGENLVYGAAIVLNSVSLLVLAFLYRHKRTAAKTFRWRDLIFVNSIVFLCLLGLLFMIGETYYRFFYDTTDSLLYTKVSQKWLERHWHRNANGLRDDIEYSPVRSPGRRRISFIGDSFTAGHGVKDIKHRFVNRIREKEPQWEVHMLAMPGFDTGDHLGFLKTCIQNGYQLDEVVLVYCLNDISDMIEERYQEINRINAEQANSTWLVRNSYFVNTILHRIKLHRDPFMRDYFAFVKQAYRGPLWDKQKERLQQFRQLVESSGGHLTVVTFPFLHAIGPNYEYQFVHDELNDFWRTSGIPHIDLLPVFRDQSPKDITVNRFDAHPNEHAHALATQAIDEFLKAHLRIK